MTLALAGIAYGDMRIHVHPSAGVQARTQSPGPTSKPSQVAPPSGSTVSGLFVWDADIVDSTTGALLATDCDANGLPTCHYFVATTSDGAKSWSRPVQVGPTWKSVDGDAPRMIRFVNRLDGFVFGHSAAFATHDGGRTWKSAGLPAVFIGDLAVFGQTVWAFTYPCAKGTVCHYEMRSSTNGGQTWSRAHELPLNFSPDAVVPFSSGVIVSSIPPGEIQLTTDEGATWQDIQAPCHSDQFRGEATTADGIELWVLCKPYPDATGTITRESLYVSEDSGRSWTAREIRVNHQDPSLPAWVVTPGPHVAFASGNDVMTLLTHDSGRTWGWFSPDYFEFVLLRFEGPERGWGMADSRVAYVTQDGGENWSAAWEVPSRLG